MPCLSQNIDYNIVSIFQNCNWGRHHIQDDKKSIRAKESLVLNDQSMRSLHQLLTSALYAQLSHVDASRERFKIFDQIFFASYYFWLNIPQVKRNQRSSDMHLLHEIS